MNMTMALLAIALMVLGTVGVAIFFLVAVTKAGTGETYMECAKRLFKNFFTRK